MVWQVAQAAWLSNFLLRNYVSQTFQGSEKFCICGRQEKASEHRPSSVSSLPRLYKETDSINWQKCMKRFGKIPTKPCMTHEHMWAPGPELRAGSPVTVRRGQGTSQAERVPKGSLCLMANNFSTAVKFWKGLKALLGVLSKTLHDLTWCVQGKVNRLSCECSTKTHSFRAKESPLFLLCLTRSRAFNLASLVPSFFFVTSLSQERIMFKSASFMTNYTAASGFWNIMANSIRFKSHVLYPMEGGRI